MPETMGKLWQIQFFEVNGCLMMLISGKICEHSPSIGDMGRFHGSGSCVEDWKVAKSVYSPRILGLGFSFQDLEIACGRHPPYFGITCGLVQIAWVYLSHPLIWVNYNDLTVLEPWKYW